MSDIICRSFHDKILREQACHGHISFPSDNELLMNK